MSWHNAANNTSIIKAAPKREPQKSAAKGSIKAGARKPWPDWPGPARGCPPARYYAPEQRVNPRPFLGDRGGAKRRIGALREEKNSDPMIEAGAPSTEDAFGSGVPAPPGRVMVAPPEVPRNASRAESEESEPLGGPCRNSDPIHGRTARGPAQR
jgi:hypothetical protein